MSLDWPYLKKYHEENAKMPTIKNGENRVVFMGDSITEFWSQLHPDFFNGKSYVNRGISGQTSPQMLIRYRADVINLKPKIVHILAGANDIAENTGPSTLDMITHNLFSMAELAKTHNIKVILCSVLPANDFPWKRGLMPAEKIVALNCMIKEYAYANNVIYLDYYTAMVNDKKALKTAYADDGVHPNKAGYQVMNLLAEKAIQKALAEN